MRTHCLPSSLLEASILVHVVPSGRTGFGLQLAQVLLNFVTLHDDKVLFAAERWQLLRSVVSDAAQIECRRFL